MAKATFKRNKEIKGYDARRRVDDRTFESHFAADGKKWFIESGDFTQDERWVKLSDLKVRWSALCDGAEDFPVPTPAGPPAIGGPPSVGPPKLGPPAISGPPAIGGPPPVGKPVDPMVGHPPLGDNDSWTGPESSTPQQTLGEPSSKNNHQNADPEKFAEFLKGRGVLLGPCNGGGDEFRCTDCGAHVSDWERNGDNFRPPCRCNRTHTNPAAFLPEWSDPMFWWFTPGPDLYMRPTPIGALDMVYNWMLAHAADCSFNGKLVDPFRTVLDTLFAETARPEYFPNNWGKE